MWDLLGQVAFAPADVPDEIPTCVLLVVTFDFFLLLLFELEASGADLVGAESFLALATDSVAAPAVVGAPRSTTAEIAPSSAAAPRRAPLGSLSLLPGI